MPVKTNLAVA